MTPINIDQIDYEKEATELHLSLNNLEFYTLMEDMSSAKQAAIKIFLRSFASKVAQSTRAEERAKGWKPMEWKKDKLLYANYKVEEMFIGKMRTGFIIKDISGRFNASMYFTRKIEKCAMETSEEAKAFCEETVLSELNSLREVKDNG